MEHPWFTILNHTSSPSYRLYCFPYAGASHTVFSHWRKALSPAVELALVKLPGRGMRYNEPQMSDLLDLAHAFAQSMPSRPAVPFAFFGHSMGALLAFEVSRWLIAHQKTTPLVLFASGSTAPSERDTLPPLSTLPADAFKQGVLAMNGIPAEIAQHDDLMDFFLPMIRTDIQLCEEYDYQSSNTLTSPIIAIGSDQDPRVPLSTLAAWQQETSSEFEQWHYPGDHFFVFQHEAELLKRIEQQVSRYLIGKH